MAGCYTHLTLVSKLIDKRVLKSIGIDAPISKILRKWSNYVKLGSISPDLPYLGLGKKWADKFHYEKTSQIVREGLVSLFGKSIDDVHTQKQIAWLLGYASHLVTDLYIHPVIEKKVGPYAENATMHRKCEMNQDVWILDKDAKLRLGYVFKNVAAEDYGVGLRYNMQVGEKSPISRAYATRENVVGEEALHDWPPRYGLVGFCKTSASYSMKKNNVRAFMCFQTESETH